jgi:hypothetical protein
MSRLIAIGNAAKDQVMGYDPDLVVVAGILGAAVLVLLIMGITSVAKRTPNTFGTWFSIRGGWRVAAIAVAAAAALLLRS